MNETCYCCDSKSTSRDHVPPRCLFSKETQYNDFITVPSCEEHNQKKSHTDEYFKFILCSSTSNISSSLIDSTVRGVFRHIKKDSKIIQKYGINKDNNEITINSELKIDIKAICDSLSKTARGIYYHHHNASKKIKSNLHVYPIFLGSNPDCPSDLRKEIDTISAYTYQDIRELPLSGNNKEVFSYQIIENKDVIVINMIFYENKIASVMCSK